MISLALDASGRVSGVCLVKDGEILGEMDLQIGLTHSETLLPLCISLLEHCKVSLEEVNQIFLCKGPGSFTGLRIGAAIGKGFGFSREYSPLWNQYPGNAAGKSELFTPIPSMCF